MGALQMRPYQQAAREAIHAEWNDGRRRTLLVLPTGTGKTIVFAAVTEDQVRSGSRVLVLAHRGELLEQAADKIKRSTGLASAVEKAEQTCLDSWCRVVVGSVQSLPTILVPSSSTRHTTRSQTDTSAYWSIFRRQTYWA